MRTQVSDRVSNWTEIVPLQSATDESLKKASKESTVFEGANRTVELGVYRILPVSHARLEVTATKRPT